jgi:hypothetical protein
MTEDFPKASDQLPEEQHPETVPDDVPEAGEGAAREASGAAAERQAGGERRDTHDEEINRLGYRDTDEERVYSERGDQTEDLESEEP